MHDAQRRTKEYELLTQIGQAISSRLDQDEILRTIQKELGQIFDTSDFYIAFQEGDEIRFELEVETIEMLPKRSRKVAQWPSPSTSSAPAQPLLIRSDLEKTRERLGVTLRAASARRSASCGAPILLGGKPAGVMVGDEHRARVRFRAARSGSDADRCRTGFGRGGKCPPVRRRAAPLAAARFPQQHFEDRDFQRRLRADAGRHRRPTSRRISASTTSASAFSTTCTKEIEIKAEAGITAQALGKRIPLGSGHSRPGGAHRRDAPWCRTRLTGNLHGRAARTRARCSASRSPMANRCWACSTSRATKKTPSRRRTC